MFRFVLLLLCVAGSVVVTSSSVLHRHSSSRRLAAKTLMSSSQNQHTSAPTVCPFHPAPIDFGDDIPASIQNALLKSTSYLETVWTNAKIPGAHLSVVYNGRTIFQWGFGTTDLALKTPRKPTGDTIYRIGSCTKTFVAIAAMQMRDGGLIDSLDDEIQKYAPNVTFTDPFHSSRGITFHEVLSQLSGLPRETPCPTAFSLFCNATTAEVLRQLPDTRLIYPPYFRPSYSNFGFALTGHVLGEKVWNATFAEWVQTHIIDALNLTQTAYNYPTAEQLPLVSKGYIDGVAVDNQALDVMWNSPAGQAYASGNDLSKLMMALMSDDSSGPVQERFLDEVSRKELMLPVFENPGGQTLFGTPWEIVRIGSYLVRRKGGNINGYSNIIAMVPELKLGVTIGFASAADEFGAGADPVMELLLPAFDKALVSLAPAPPLPPSSAAVITGSWLLLNSAHVEFRSLAYSATNPAPAIFFQGGLGNSNGRSLMLKWVEDDTYQLVYHPAAASLGNGCLGMELGALVGEYFYFSHPQKGVATKVIAPGSLLSGVRTGPVSPVTTQQTHATTAPPLQTSTAGARCPAPESQRWFLPAFLGAASVVIFVAILVVVEKFRSNKKKPANHENLHFSSLNA